MKPLCLIVFLFSLRTLALAAETPAAQAALGSGAVSDGGKAFEDPFASDDEHTNAPPAIKDPLQSMNRAFFKFNDKLYFWVLKPVGKGYGKVVPRAARTCIRRLFVNVKYPVYFVNNLLQGKLKAAGLETTRFVVNSTVGVGGLFDPAQRWKIEPHPADFDQTLGFYGFRTGIYFDWPIFGPCSVRGTAGLAGDGALSPWNYIDGIGVAFGVPAYREVNGASLRLGDYESFKKATLDPYAAMRSAYFESRAQAVRESKAQSETAKPHTVVISQDDFCGSSGQPSATVVLAPGDLLVVKLGSNRSTDYHWNERPVNSCPEILAQEGHVYTPLRLKFGSGQPMVGAGGVETWTFKVASTGMATLDFSYGQAPERGAKVTWTVRIVAKVEPRRG